MNIYEAAKLAKENDMCISQEGREGEFKIKPTNDRGNCILIPSEGNPSKYGWQPSQRDLLATDWVVVK